MEKWHQEAGPFDVILCLNLLDRCDKPNTLLRRLKSTMSPGGRLIVAIVLPFSPYVEVGERNDHKPSEYLPIKGNGLEGQIASLIDRVFSPLGLKCLAWSKLPYLCEGDLGQAFYFLDDVVFVLEAEEVTFKICLSFFIYFSFKSLNNNATDRYFHQENFYCPVDEADNETKFSNSTLDREPIEFN